MYIAINISFYSTHTATIAIISITEDVQSMTVTIGQHVNFSCAAVGSKVDIKWTVDDTEYNNCPPQGDADICFENSYMSDTATTRSILIIADTSGLGLGIHTVQCILQKDQTEDMSVIGRRTAFLRIQALTSESHSSLSAKLVTYSHVYCTSI